jgi:hypothetical protein
MPWLSEAKKDVRHCEKLWGGVNYPTIHRYLNGATRYVEDISQLRLGERGELKHLSTHRRRKQT